MKLCDNHEILVNELQGLLQPWKRFLIVVDGLTGSGKSGLARFLSWRLDMPLIEVDMLRNMEQEQPSYRLPELKNLICSRFELNRPVIVEGIFIQSILKELDLKPDYLILTKNSEANAGYALRDSLPSYLNEYKVEENADFIFNTDFANM